MTTEQQCAALQISRSMVYRLIGEGCPHMQLGDARRFQLAAVLECGSRAAP